jgi:negative regulator of sigma E activity
MKEFFATNRLSAYIDGELSDAEMAEVEKSIRENPSVRAEYSRMLNAVELLRSQGPVEAPEGFSERLAALLATEPLPRSRTRWIPKPFRHLPLEAFGLAIAAVLVVFLIQRGPAEENQEDGQSELVVQEDPVEPSETPSESKEPEVVQEELAASLENSQQRVPAEAATKKERVVRTPVLPKDPTESSSVPSRANTEAGGASGAEAAPLEEVGAMDWEEQFAEAGSTKGERYSGPTVAMGPVRYRLFPKSSEILWQIERLAQLYGARLMKSAGGKLSPFSMTTEENYANLKIQMSPERMEAFVAALQDLGAMSLVRQDDTRLYGGGMMELELEVQYEP